jgi:hypothetical protein
LKVTKRGNKFFILAVDYYSKLVIARAVQSCNSAESILFLREDLINKFGSPESILSDQGTIFESAAFAAFCTKYNIRKVRTTPYHPQGNGLAERTIRTIKEMLALTVNSSHDNWDDMLSEVVFSYNNTVHSSTGFAPNQIIFGRTLPSATDRQFSIEPEQSKSHEQVVQEVDKRLEQAREVQSNYFNKHAKQLYNFKVGDLVLLSNNRQKYG